MANYLSDFNVVDGAIPSGQLEFLTGTGTIVSNRAEFAAGSPVKLSVRPETLTRDNYVVHGIVNLGGAVTASQRMGICFCVTGTGDYYYIPFKPGAFGKVYLYRVKGFTQTLLYTHPPSVNIDIQNGVDYKLEARVSGIGTATVTIEVYLDDVFLFSFDDSSDPLPVPGRAGFYMNNATGDAVQFDNLTIEEGQASPIIVIDQADQTVMNQKDETEYPFTFTATATDEEDGVITSNISWDISTDGGPTSSIGTGGSVSTNLPIGVNTVTATVTDSNAATTVESVVITVLAFDFGGETPVVGGFIDGDTYTGNGIRLLLTQPPTNGKLFVTETGELLFYPDSPAVTQTTFSYRIKDQEGISNEATITINISAP